MPRYFAKRRGRYRSQFEAQVAAQLPADFRHESRRFDYVLKKQYLPDFVDETNRIIVEAKGTLADVADRMKMLAVKEQHPDWHVVLWFAEPDRLIPGMRCTHRQWALKHGFTVI